MGKLKILMVTDGCDWVVDRITAIIVKGVPHEFITMSMKANADDLLKTGNKCDLVHFQNWIACSKPKLIEKLEVPIIVSCRSFRFPPRFRNMALDPRVNLHVISPQLKSEFPNGYYLPDGIFDQFSPEEFVVGFAGRPDEYKGFPLIKKACEQLGVTFRPALDVPADKMPEYFKSISLYACASENEGHSTPVMECLAMNVPVITTDVGLASTFDVYKIDRSVEGIKAGIRHFCTNLQVSDLYWSKMIPRYTALYERVVSEQLSKKEKMELSWWNTHRQTPKKFVNKYLMLLRRWGVGGDLKSVLDVGCGPLCGFLPHVVAERKVGIDPLVSRYREQGFLKFTRGVELIEGGIESTVLREQYDWILSANALDHGDSDFGSIRNINKMLKPGGTFCLHVHLREPKELNDRHDHRLKIEDLKAVIKECGLKALMLDVVPSCPYDGNYRSVIARFEKPGRKSGDENTEVLTEKEGTLVPVYESSELSYIRMTKCGSTSVVGSMFGTASVWREKEVSSERLLSSGKRVFTVTRNPYSRLVSGWSDKNLYQRYREHGLVDGMSFQDFAEKVCSIPDGVADAHFMSMAWILDSLGCELSFWIDMEELDRKWPEVASKYGFRPLKRENSSAHEDWKTYYDSDLAEMVFKRYRRDFELFGYEKESWKA